MVFTQLIYRKVLEQDTVLQWHRGAKSWVRHHTGRQHCGYSHPWNLIPRTLCKGSSKKLTPKDFLRPLQEAQSSSPATTVGEFGRPQFCSPNFKRGLRAQGGTLGEAAEIPASQQSQSFIRIFLSYIGNLPNPSGFEIFLIGSGGKSSAPWSFYSMKIGRVSPAASAPPWAAPLTFLSLLLIVLNLGCTGCPASKWNPKLVLLHFRHLWSPLRVQASPLFYHSLKWS